MEPSEEMAILMCMFGFKWRVQPFQWLHPYLVAAHLNRDAAKNLPYSVRLWLYDCAL